MKWFLLALGCLLAAGLLMALIGAMIPRDHVASRSATFRCPPGDLFAAAHDFASQPSWRRSLVAVDVLPSEDGRARFRERTARRSITYRVLDDVSPARLVFEIADTNLPFGGTWTLDFAPTRSGGTVVTITERGIIKPAVFRFLSRFVIGYTTSIDQYLLDLGRHLGQDG
ncbi:MAG: SRPBCC family protein [Acidobacteriota bacterium]